MVNSNITLTHIYIQIQECHFSWWWIVLFNTFFNQKGENWFYFYGFKKQIIKSNIGEYWSYQILVFIWNEFDNTFNVEFNDGGVDTSLVWMFINLYCLHF